MSNNNVVFNQFVPSKLQRIGYFVKHHYEALRADSINQCDMLSVSRPACRECLSEAHEPCDCQTWRNWLQKVTEMKPEERTSAPGRSFNGKLVSMSNVF